MDKLKTTTEKTEVCSLVKEFSTEQPIDCSVSLPEYFGDIVKVLKCNVNPVASSVTCNSGRITAEGVNVIRIIYISENGGIYSYETSEQFSKYIDASGLDGECSIVDLIKAEAVVCRAVSPRRLEVRGNVRFKYSVYKKTGTEVVSSADGLGIQTRMCSYLCENMQNIVSKKITVNETYELPNGKPAVNRIISVFAESEVNDTKAISNKIMVKGNVNYKILYVTDTENESIEILKFPVPFSEIVDVNGINDETVNKISVDVLNSEASMKPVQNGSMRIIECTAALGVTVSYSEQSEHTVVRDAFSMDYETKISTVNINKVIQSVDIKENFVSSSSFELADIAPESIIDYDCKINTVKTALKDGKIIVSGTVLFSFLLNTAAGTLSNIERNLDFGFSKELGDTDGEPVFSPSLSVYASSAVLNGHKADVKAEIFIEGSLLITDKITVVSDIAVDESSLKQKDNSGLIIYFADKNENVWEIAKKYNTSPDLITKDNKLSDEVIAQKQTLLISCI